MLAGLRPTLAQLGPMLANSDKDRTDLGQLWLGQGWDAFRPELGQLTVAAGIRHACGCSVNSVSILGVVLWMASGRAFVRECVREASRALREHLCSGSTLKGVGVLSGGITNDFLLRLTYRCATRATPLRHLDLGCLPLLDLGGPRLAHRIACMAAPFAGLMLVSFRTCLTRLPPATSHCALTPRLRRSVQPCSNDPEPRCSARTPRAARGRVSYV